jgi:crossover junction endodeoxyribonuclease RuvC
MAITPKQFADMQKRMARTGRAPVPVFESSPRRTATREIIIGIDPSLRGTGWGLIRTGQPHATAVAYGTILCPSTWERSRCLFRISQTLRELIAKHRPTVCAIEGLFYAQNLQTALIMGEARGAALAVLAEAGLEIYEIAPRKVKQAIVGYGAAQKVAVAKMVQRLLRLSEPPASDAADALALALAYSHERGRFGLGTPKRV